MPLSLEGSEASMRCLPQSRLLRRCWPDLPLATYSTACDMDSHCRAHCAFSFLRFTALTAFIRLSCGVDARKFCSPFSCLFLLRPSVLFWLTSFCFSQHFSFLLFLFTSVLFLSFLFHGFPSFLFSHFLLAFLPLRSSSFSSTSFFLFVCLFVSFPSTTFRSVLSISFVLYLSGPLYVHVLPSFSFFSDAFLSLNPFLLFCSLSISFTHFFFPSVFISFSSLLNFLFCLYRFYPSFRDAYLWDRIRWCVI